MAKIDSIHGDLTLTLICNNNCIFCPRSYFKENQVVPSSIDEILKDIKLARNYSEGIILSGGEVTLLNQLPDIIKFCKKQGFTRVGIITNGRMLDYKSFLDKLITAGLTDLAISFYSLDEQIHDRITRVRGSLKQTMKGIINAISLLKENKINFRINTVLNYWNHRTIIQDIRTLYSLGVRDFLIAEQIAIDKAVKHLNLKQVRDTLNSLKLIEIPNAKLWIRGFPPCIFKGAYRKSGKNHIIRGEKPLITVETHNIENIINKRSEKGSYFKAVYDTFTKLKTCSECRFNNDCLGLQKVYLKENYGKIINPVR